MKRYQNPDVFEPLAMAYALGTLQGRARARFQKLMAKHFYLRVVTEAYEHQFAGLAGLLPPEDPPAVVWQRLESELGFNETTVQPKKESKWLAWSEWFHWPAMAVASVLAAVVTVFVMNSAQTGPDAYFANLRSLGSESVAMASVSKKEMAITIAMTEKLKVGEGLQPTLWCLSKKPGEKPIRMGALNTSGKTQLSINADTFRGLADVSQFAITLEPAGAANAEFGGEQLFVGDLMKGKK
ncbi:MAG: anti-sigma factor [Thiolinea sp.]